MAELETILGLTLRYRQLPSLDERERLRKKYGFTYAKMGKVLCVTRECAWRWTTGQREPRPEYQERWVQFWEALMALERIEP